MLKKIWFSGWKQDYAVARGVRHAYVIVVLECKQDVPRPQLFFQNSQGPRIV